MCLIPLSGRFGLIRQVDKAEVVTQADFSEQVNLNRKELVRVQKSDIDVLT